MPGEKIGILGAGSWATALVKILSNNASHINWWARKQETIDHIKKYRHNPNYLSDVELPVEKISFYSNLKEVIANSDVLLIAVPSAFMSESFKGLSKNDFQGKMIFSLIKGTLPDKKMMVSQYFHQHFEFPLSSFGMIAGPCHAEEVALEKLSYLTVACSNQPEAEKMANLLNCRYIKARTSPDMQGIEYTAALKNIYAVASGICHGLGGYGDNFQAVLVTNAMQEIKRFIDVAYPTMRDTNLISLPRRFISDCLFPFQPQPHVGKFNWQRVFSKICAGRNEYGSGRILCGKDFLFP